jgi:iron complex transport system substrate-binding protein
MGQRPARALAPNIFLAIVVPAMLSGLCGGCDRKPVGPVASNPANASADAAQARKVLGRAEPSVASLSPAATDLLVGMGAADHLVAVSNFDTARDEIAGLPRVGDYRTQDWEKLAALRPRKMVIQLHPDRTPDGLRDRAAGLQIDLVNVQIDSLEDVFAAIPRLAAAADEAGKGTEALKRLRDQFDTVRHRVAAAPKVRAIVVVDVGGRSVAGPGTFLHDILTAAGGENAAEALNNPWPTVDREKIAQLDPQVVIHLLPQASPQVLRQAEQFWAAMPDLPAVKSRHVHYLTEWYVMLPGYHVGQVAEQFALVLHPFANVGPLNPAPAGGPPDSLLPPPPR